MSQKARLVFGCMTGTSLDGLDTVLAEIAGRGLRMRVTIRDRRSARLGRLAAPLRALAEQQPCTAGAIARLARDFSLLHARVLARFGVTPDLVVVHGQTVFHAPPVSWLLLTPAVIAERLGCAVISDLRAADLAAGGEGAPITPLADLILYGHARERRTVINLGGFCNLTRLPAGREPVGIRGGDVCACNQVLDAVARNAASSWTQSGHLKGKVKKLRQPLKPHPVALSLALWMGYASGKRGKALLNTPWATALDSSSSGLLELAEQAKRQGLLKLSHGAGVVSIDPSGLDTHQRGEQP